MNVKLAYSIGVLLATKQAMVGWDHGMARAPGSGLNTIMSRVGSIVGPMTQGLKNSGNIAAGTFGALGAGLKKVF